jgi:hypothetical protein
MQSWKRAFRKDVWILNFQFNYENFIIETYNHRIVSCDKSSISEEINVHPTYAVASFSLFVSQLAGSLSVCFIVTDVDCMGWNPTAVGCIRLIFLYFCPISLYYFSLYFPIAFYYYFFTFLFVYLYFSLFSVFSLCFCLYLCFLFLLSFVFLCSLFYFSSYFSNSTFTCPGKAHVKLLSGVRGGALRYKPEGRGFDGAIGNFYWLNLSGRNMIFETTQPLNRNA